MGLFCTMCADDKLIAFPCCYIAGNRTYVGYVYMEYTQNNSVLHAFIEVICATVKQKAITQSLHHSSECQNNENEPSGRRVVFTAYQYEFELHILLFIMITTVHVFY